MVIWADQPFDLCAALSSKVAQVSPSFFYCDTIWHIYDYCSPFACVCDWVCVWGLPCGRYVLMAALSLSLSLSRWLARQRDKLKPQFSEHGNRQGKPWKITARKVRAKATATKHISFILFDLKDFWLIRGCLSALVKRFLFFFLLKIVLHTLR